MKRIFIVAGDPSGDIHASRLMESLKQKDTGIEFIGIGGKRMTDSGLMPVAPVDKMSVVGFWEVAKRYGYFKKILKKCSSIFKNERIDAFIPVDYPGFNIRLAQKAKENNIPVIYYIAPQLWAWGKNRSKKLFNRIDLLLAVFPFEAEFFLKYGLNVEFIGHPLLDDPVFSGGFPNPENRENLIAFLPGSREQEVVTHLPVMEYIAALYQQRNPGYRIGISMSSSVDKSIYKNIFEKHEDWEAWENSRELMLKAKAGVVKTGTSNLEAALCGMPYVMIYKTSALSYLLGRQLVNLPYLSLVNILSNHKIINEYIQGDIDIEKITTELEYLSNDLKKAKELQEVFEKIKMNLGESGAASNAAESIMRYLNENEA
jgi:lipid-A-disaccharide synthase